MATSPPDADEPNVETPAERLLKDLDRNVVNGNEVGNMPPAKIIVPELGITERSTVEVFGRMKAGKTFFNLDLACSMAAGVEWRGHKLTARRVLYMIGEGTPGLGARIRAWKYDRGINDLGYLIFQPTRLSLMDRDSFHALCAWVRARGPFGMVVLDTMARYSVGANENTSEMALVVARAETIRDLATSDGPLIIVHHSGRGATDHGRGHTSVEAACDLVVKIGKDGNKVAAEVVEARHGPDGAILRSTIEAVPEAREPGEKDDPAVIVPDLSGIDSFLPDSRRQVLEALETLHAGGDTWVSSGKWIELAEMPASTFHRAKKDLIQRQWVEVDETGRYPRFRAVDRGDDTAPEQGF